MEGSHTIARLELGDLFSDRDDSASDVVALVCVRTSLCVPLGPFPVGVSTRRRIGGEFAKHTHQSLGFEPEIATFVRTCIGPGVGIGVS